MHFLANQKQANLESPWGFSIPLVINFATKTSHASILFDSISCSFSGSASMAGWHCYVNFPYNPTLPNFIIKMMCEIKSHNGTIMALGEICFFPNVSLRGYPSSGRGSITTGELRYEKIGDARNLVWECKISTAGGFQEEKLIFLPTQIYHLGNWQVLRNIYKENQTPSFFETERLSITSYCSVPAGDSYMKESGVLVVSLRSVNFSLEFSGKLITYPSPKPT